jgi:hypothetical protein
MRAHWLLASLPMSLLACTGGDADDKAPGHWTPDKSDGAFALVEAGPAAYDAPIAVTLERAVPGYRVESYGGTKLSIDLSGKGADAYLVVEGPLANAGDALKVGAGKVVAEDDDSGSGHDAHVDITLDKPGVYRILAGTYDSLGAGGPAKGSLSLNVSCSANCTRASIDQKAFVQLLASQGGAAFAAQAKEQIAAFVHDPTMAAQLGAQLDAIMAKPDLAGLERFPTIPLSQVSTVRPALGGLPSDPPKPDQVITGDLETILGDCAPDRSLPKEIDARLPGVRYGQFPSGTLSPCQFAHAKKLGDVLTSLAANNGSSVTLRGATITSPRELFAKLVETGHSIQVRNERMYANFLSMIVGDKDLIWPVWLDTGIQLSTGESFVIPMGHSHHAYRISGPIVNTRVMFYLGVSGTGFFGQTDQRPAWSGTIAATDVTIASASSSDYEYLLSTVDAASAYLRRNRVERETVAKGLPADGYGFVGVCNDSNAAVELASHGTTSAFPLVRAAQLDSAADLNDGLDEVIRSLPKDADGITDPADALRRAVAMQPHPDGSPLMWDAKLGAQIATARKQVH